MYQAKDKRMSDMLLLSRNQLFAKYVSHVIPSLTGSELYQQTLVATYHRAVSQNVFA